MTVSSMVRLVISFIRPRRLMVTRPILRSFLLVSPPCSSSSPYPTACPGAHRACATWVSGDRRRCRYRIIITHILSTKLHLVPLLLVPLHVVPSYHTPFFSAQCAAASYLTRLARTEPSALEQSRTSASAPPWKTRTRARKSMESAVCANGGAKRGCRCSV